MRKRNRLLDNKRILFAGYYGFRNIGDDMFGLVTTFGARQYWKNPDTALLSGQGPVSDKIDIKYVLPLKTHFRGQLTLQSCLEILRSNFLVLSGGSILHSKPNMLSPKRFALLLAKLNYIKMGAIGVSVGPFESDVDSRYVESVLQKLKFLAVRDKRSYNVACGMDLPYKPILAADLAFVLPHINKLSLTNDATKKNRVVGISMCHYERYVGQDVRNEKRREDAMLSVLHELKRSADIRFRFFIANGSRQAGDFELTQNIIQRLRLDTKIYELIPFSSDTLAIFDLISSCDVMYSTRLHGAIFAAAANVPSMLVEYHQKCIDYLCDMGIQEKWRIGDMRQNPKIIAELIQELMALKQNTFYPNRDLMIQLALENFTNDAIIKEMLQ